MSRRYNRYDAYQTQVDPSLYTGRTGMLVGLGNSLLGGLEVGRRFADDARQRKAQEQRMAWELEDRDTRSEDRKRQLQQQQEQQDWQREQQEQQRLEWGVRAGDREFTQEKQKREKSQWEESDQAAAMKKRAEGMEAAFALAMNPGMPEQAKSVLVERVRAGHGDNADTLLQELSALPPDKLAEAREQVLIPLGVLKDADPTEAFQKLKKEYGDLQTVYLTAAPDQKADIGRMMSMVDAQMEVLIKAYGNSPTYGKVAKSYDLSPGGENFEQMGLDAGIADLEGKIEKVRGPFSKGTVGEYQPKLDILKKRRSSISSPSPTDDPLGLFR